MRLKRLLSSILLYASLPVLLAACAQAPTGCAALPDGSHYCLQPTILVPAFSVRQQVKADFKGQREMLIADIDNQASGMQFTGFTPFGLTVFQAAYDNHTATAARLPDPRLSAELLLSMLQLALWPADAITRGFSGDIEVSDTPGQRRILSRGELLMEMQHDPSPLPYQRMQIRWPGLGLNLDIQVLPEDTP